MWTRGWRDEVFSRLDQPWDVVIVGGGITGAGILSEAARHGKKALLVEGADFASGTSSRSTKLVHGGLRYLRQGQFLVTRKSVREREKMMREGAGLVENLAFSLAAFPGDEMPKWMYGMGLAMYDMLAWKWAHEAQDVGEIVERVPPLAGSAVLGGYRYFDAQTDDARMVLRVVREGVRLGGTAVNYARAEKLLRSADGKVHGVVVRDVAPGASRAVEVKAKIVINATGAWADDLRKDLGQATRLRKIRGSHLTFAHERLPIPEAVSLLHPRDQRAVFAVPWEGVTIFGTTDVDHGPDLTEEPAISEGEASYLLEAVQKAFPSLELGERDVIGTWSGVRPVIDTGKKDPSKESREHAIWKENGLLTITGGKLTTFGVMARDVLAEAEDEIGALGARTHVFEPVPEVAFPDDLADGLRVRLTGRHGAEVADLVADRGGLAPLAGTVAFVAELRHAARSEGVVKLDDLLLRRVRLGFLLPEGGRAAMADVRRIAQPELGWDDARWEAEEKAYYGVWKRAYAMPLNAKGGLKAARRINPLRAA